MQLVQKKFSDILIEDPFFNSLKEDYLGFDVWFNKKALSNEFLYVTENRGVLTGVLYLKIEDEEHSDIVPTLPKKKRLKVGTLKIDAHGTNLGQYYISKIVHEAVYQKLDEIYITIFQKHKQLIKLVERYGFILYGTKTTKSGVENVYIKNLSIKHNNILKDYPLFSANTNIYLLSIYPKWHTILFGNSILKTENPDELLQDISHTNSIHKVYICGMNNIDSLKTGDVLVIYRSTTDNTKSPYYHSVATSICVVTEYKHMYSYANMEDMVKDIERYSVFSSSELREFYQRKQYPHIIKMTYNVPLKKRITMQKLMDECGLTHQEYWGFRKLTKEQFDNIIKHGGVDENFIIN